MNEPENQLFKNAYQNNEKLAIDWVRIFRK